MKLEPIYQMKSQDNESWIDIPENLYKSGVIKNTRILFPRADIEILHQEAIANYYNTDGDQNYYKGQMDLLEELLALPLNPETK